MGSRRNSSVVASIVIPEALLQSQRDNLSWTPRKPSAVSHSSTLPSISEPAPALTRPKFLRKTTSHDEMKTEVLTEPVSQRQGSFPTTKEEYDVVTAKPRRLSRLQFESRPSSRKQSSLRKESAIRKASKVAFEEPSLPTKPSPPKRPGAPTSDMFRSLSYYSMNGQGSSDPSSDDISEYGHDPHAPRPDNEPRPSVSPSIMRNRRMSRVASILPHSIRNTARRFSTAVRRSSIADVYERAKIRGAQLQRTRPFQLLFEYTFYFLLLAFIYFVLIGMPLWRGAVWWLYWVVETKFGVSAGFAITIAVAAAYAYFPLLILFEKDPPPVEEVPACRPEDNPSIRDTALLVPCYKSAGLIAATLDAAIKIFPPKQIFVIANGNSPTPLDDTEEVCKPYGVNHIWSPVGSKIVAQFVGCYAAKEYKDVLLIDDDCALPPNFPVVGDRLVGKVKSIGYTIKSVGPNSSKGTLCHQAQDLEYKLSGLQRAFAGKIGSATFPHGAISLWDRAFLVKVFHDHPGFSVSEDWFFGHSCRRLGGRIKMCSATFTETETPSAVFISSGGSRGGFGEMTVFTQRFLRWNFFFVNGMYYDLWYILGSWKLGWWEIGAKLFVFQEVYETLFYLLTPFVVPISLIVRPIFWGYLYAATLALYFINVLIFNEIHLRLKKERIGWVCLWVYYIPYKLLLTLVNVASCYWSIYKYAQYFSKRHPKVIEDEHAVGIVLRLEEDVDEKPPEMMNAIGRRMTVTAMVASRHGSHISTPRMHGALGSDSDEDHVQVVDFAAINPPRRYSRRSSRVTESRKDSESQDSSESGEGWRRGSIMSHFSRRSSEVPPSHPSPSTRHEFRGSVAPSQSSPKTRHGFRNSFAPSQSSPLTRHGFQDSIAPPQSSPDTRHEFRESLTPSHQPSPMTRHGFRDSLGVSHPSPLLRQGLRNSIAAQSARNVRWTDESDSRKTSESQSPV